MYFDMSAMPVPDQIRARTAAEKFIKTQMTPADLMADDVLSRDRLQVLQDFTDDSATRWLKILDKLIIGEDQGLD